MNIPSTHSNAPGGVTAVHDGLTSKQPPERAFVTYRFRIKDSSCKTKLFRMAGAVNFTWNFCNDATRAALDFNGQWLSAYDLGKLAIGASSQLGIARDSIDMVIAAYITKRQQAKQAQLAWRSRKRSLGWIPFRRNGFSINAGVVRYGKHRFKIWNSREVIGVFRCGSFNQDARGHWYVNIVCELPESRRNPNGIVVGMDLGLKTTATMSDGTTFNHAPLADLAQKLAISQRAGHKKRTAAIHAKVANRRKDYLHKRTTEMVLKYDGIYVGNVSPSKLKKTRMAKSVGDNGWAMLKSMLAYKAIRLGVDYREVNEKFSTVTCSTCLQRTGPSGLSALGVREWACSCGVHHDRDVNAAKNILRVALDTPIKGAAQGGEANTGRGGISPLPSPQ